MITTVELGSGCGAALIGFALLAPEAVCLGLDCEKSLVEAANQNAHKLGLESRVKFIRADLETDAPPPGLSCEIALANPPWLKPASGRLPQGSLRRRAICQQPRTLRAFCRYAAHILRNRGHLCLILPAALLCGFCECIADLPLGLRKILPLASHADKPASRLLLLAKKDAASDPRLLPPLILHEKGHGWTEAAQSFCPWLAKG